MNRKILAGIAAGLLTTATLLIVAAVAIGPVNGTTGPSRWSERS